MVLLECEKGVQEHAQKQLRNFTTPFGHPLVVYIIGGIDVVSSWRRK